MSRRISLRKLPYYLTLDRWQRWEYKHTTVLIVSLLAFVAILDTALAATVLDSIAGLGYIGAFIAGLLFVSLFTAAPSVVLLVTLAASGLNPWLIALVAGLGSMTGDYIILRLVEDKLAYELKPIALRLGIPQAIKYLQGRAATTWLVRLLGAVIIASPLPDEIGIGLLGASRLGKLQFLGLCYVLNAAGIALLLGATG